MIEDWMPEMDMSPEKIHRLLIDNNTKIMNLKKFKDWMELKYKAAEIYDTLEAQHVWEDVMGKFNELFE
jgi:hypothetical protein